MARPVQKSRPHTAPRVLHHIPVEAFKFSNVTNCVNCDMVITKQDRHYTTEDRLVWQETIDTPQQLFLKQGGPEGYLYGACYGERNPRS